MYGCFACIHVCASHECLKRARRGCRSLKTRVTNGWAAVWVWGFDSGSSRKLASAPVESPLQQSHVLLLLQLHIPQIHLSCSFLVTWSLNRNTLKQQFLMCGSWPLWQTSISKILTLQFNTIAKLQLWRSIVLWSGITTWGTVLQNHSLRKAENHCSLPDTNLFPTLNSWSS